MSLFSASFSSLKKETNSCDSAIIKHGNDKRTFPIAKPSEHDGYLASYVGLPYGGGGTDKCLVPGCCCLVTLLRYAALVLG